MKSYVHCPHCTSKMIVGELGYDACPNPSCGFIHYQNPTPVAAAIVELHEKEVILAHNVTWPPNWFGLITGFVEKNENPDDTVIREVHEELGLRAISKQFIGHYTFPRMNQLIIAYHVRAEGEVQLNEELDAYRSVPFGKVKYWPAGTGYALRDYLHQLGYAPEMLNFG